MPFFLHLKPPFLTVNQKSERLIKVWATETKIFAPRLEKKYCHTFNNHISEKVLHKQNCLKTGKYSSFIFLLCCTILCYVPLILFFHFFLWKNVHIVMCIHSLTSWVGCGIIFVCWKYICTWNVPLDFRLKNSGRNKELTKPFTEITWTHGSVSSKPKIIKNWF